MIAIGEKISAIQDETKQDKAVKDFHSQFDRRYQQFLENNNIDMKSVVKKLNSLQTKARLNLISPGVIALDISLPRIPDIFSGPVTVPLNVTNFTNRHPFGGTNIVATS